MTYQVHVTWQDHAQPGIYTGRTHQGPTPLLTYAEVLGPYALRADAEAAERRARKQRPGADTEIVQQRAHPATTTD